MSKNPQPAGAIKVFFSYAHEDEALRLRLEKHFSFLKHERKIAQWYDGKIKAGEEWRGRIEKHLDAADVILLLVSADFAHSDFCYSVEMERAMRRHDAGEAVVVPIRLHPCDWQEAPFAKLQALPAGDLAISEWPNVETALYEVARGVREIIEKVLEERAAATPHRSVGKKPVASAYVTPPPAIDFVPRKKGEGRSVAGQPKQEFIQNTEPRSKIFISYSHRDKKWLERLQTMLKPAMRKREFDVWDDTQIKAGAEWQDEIRVALETAKVAILLVSQNFLASDFIVEHELQPLLEEARNKGVTILWVAVSACLYKETDIANFQAANDPAKPLNSLRSAEVNNHLVKICEQIIAALDSQ